jgi:hypothetical protein
VTLHLTLLSCGFWPAFGWFQGAVELAFQFVQERRAAQGAANGFGAAQMHLGHFLFGAFGEEGFEIGAKPAHECCFGKSIVAAFQIGF